MCDKTPVYEKNGCVSPSAYTLIELLISSVIFAILALSVYSAFYAGIFGSEIISESARVYQSASEVMACVNDDVRNAVMFSRDESCFEGGSTEMRFLSVEDTFRQDVPDRDYACITYKFENETLLRQCRLNIQALNSESNVEFEEMASSVQEAVFKYGKADRETGDIEWLQGWHEQDALPDAVKFTLVIGEKDKYAFERTIYLPCVQ